MTIVQFGFALLVSAIAISFLAHEGESDEETNARLYCDMRAVHANTGGEFGWPNHDAVKETYCNTFDL